MIPTKTIIPIGWEQIKLGKIGKAIIGLTYSPNDVVHSGGTLVLRSSNIKGNKIDYKDQVRVKIPVSEKFITKKGDILICARNGSKKLIGKNAYIDEHSANNAFGAFMCVYRTKSSRYISWFFQSESFKRQIARDLGPTINQVTSGNLISFKILLPPLPEQEKIVEVLETWDNYLEKLTRVIKSKKKVKKGLVQKLLGGIMRLQGFNTPWKRISAGEIFKSVTKKNFPDEELLSATQDNGIIPRNMLDGRVTMPEGSRASYKLVEPHNFVISLRSFQGGLEYSRYRGIVSPAYTILTEKKKINHDFYRYYFKSYDFIGHLNVAVIGIRDGKQISFDDFCTVKISDIPYEEQAAIAQILTAADQEIEALEMKKSLIEQQKKFLLNNLITGKIRLSEFIK